MPVLSIREIYEAARDAGFTPHQAVTWTAIAMAESRGGPAPSTTRASTRSASGRSTWPAMSEEQLG